MKPKYMLAAVILCLACLIVFCILTYGNFLPKKEMNLCPVEGLFLDREDLSGDVIVNPIDTNFSDHAILGTRDIYYNGLDHGQQYVLEYPDNAKAAERYRKAKNNLFDPDNLYLPAFDEVDHSVVWKVPDIVFESHADESYYACGESDQGYVCRYIARYGRLLTRLFLDIKPVTGPTVTNFQEAITAIDRKMAKCIADYPDER
ncbi:MAG TPA: hypothetical protein PKW33_02420 [Anaerolineaceae bacterium]|nr:hypothetical protein [Anaerolineaceae bacterium]HPN50415.1 hypothetical protein [Anaerolineaceae bacterium]